MGQLLNRMIGWSCASLLGLVWLCWLGVAHAAPVAPVAPHGPFAKVGDMEIDAQTFYDAVRVGIRQKFYHASIPVEQRDAFLREVGNSLVDHVLLVKEAKRRNLTVDQSLLDEKVAEYDQKYAKDAEWLARRESLMPLMEEQLREQMLLKQLETQVRTLPDVDVGAVEAYYKANPDKFTEPMDQKVSVILLKVDPSAGGEAWRKAHDKAEDLVKQLKSGANFVDMARSHSGDVSAQNGGKMDYSHKGMLAPEAEKALEKIPVGGIVGPVMVLEGVAIFRLDDRVPPKLVRFHDVEKRARALLTREMSNQAWNTLKKRLRDETSVFINEEYYLPLPAPGTESSPSASGQSAPVGVDKP